MKKLLKVLLAGFIFMSIFTGCESETKTISVNFENAQKLNDSNIGVKSLIEIGSYLYYDSSTRIVYWWNGYLGSEYYSSSTPTPYYAPNGLPYRYNPETNTFEEIKRE